METKREIKKAVSSKKSTTSKAKKKEKEDILICNTDHLSKMFGVSIKQVYNQANNGIVVKVGANKFDCVQSVANYINQIRDQEKKRKQTPEEILNETAIVKLQHEEYKARKTELVVLQMEGKLHYAEDVKALWNANIVAAKSKLLGIAVKVAPQIIGETNEGIIQEYINREIRDVLKDLSNYNAESYVKDLSTNNSGEEEEDNDD